MKVRDVNLKLGLINLYSRNSRRVIITIASIQAINRRLGGAHARSVGATAVSAVTPGARELCA